MSAYLTAIDIFCLPSLQQGFGVIMLEAMALGRPAIASGVGGILSIIEDNVNGLVVPPSDSRALADRILELLKNHDFAHRIATAGQKLVEEKFTVDRMLEETIALYKDAHRSGIPAKTIPLTTRKGGGT